MGFQAVANTSYEIMHRNGTFQQRHTHGREFRWAPFPPVTATLAILNRDRVMRKFGYSTLVILFFALAFSCPVRADLVIVLANESDLPFSLSPSDFSNSPNKFSNSISKFSNSTSKFSNSSAKFENSPSKSENGKNGERRILRESDGSYYYLGYYVRNDEGLINYFSSDGERLFYTPPETGALFSSDNGEFCGTLAILKDELVIVLTEKGQLAFPEEGITITDEPKTKSKSASGIYSGAGSGHWIEENVDSGTILILEDGSLWQIDPIDKIDAMLWLLITDITVVASSDGSSGYDYLLINTDDGEKAHAKYLGNK